MLFRSVADTNKLVAFISGIPLDLRVRAVCVAPFSTVSLAHPFRLQDETLHRDQLPLRPQKASFQASRPPPHQGGHSSHAPPRHLPGDLHCRRLPPYPHLAVSVPPPLAQPEEARRSGLLRRPSAPHHGAHDSREQASGDDGGAGIEGDGEARFEAG